jgi:CheY-like chemotaxis protein/HPt (histidine-containing phosphotransfer) domain-containing protein
MGKNHPLRILLAEDNVVNQKVATSLLNRIGYRADLAANGLEVLDALKRQHYDVIFMDAQMPEMDGEEATIAIRQRWPATEQPRIIAMTANVLHGDRERYLALGMDDYVPKPVSISDLSRALLASHARTDDAEESAPTFSRAVAIAPELLSSSPVDAPADTGLVDPAALDQYLQMMGDEGIQFVKELVAMYLSDTPKLIDQLKEGLVEANADNVRRVAHTMKGNSRTIGAMTLAELCLDMENLGKASQLDRCGDLCDRICQGYSSVENELMHSSYGPEPD